MEVINPIDHPFHNAHGIRRVAVVRAVLIRNSSHYFELLSFAHIFRPNFVVSLDQEMLSNLIKLNQQ
jgi:hypothetical protein